MIPLRRLELLALFFIVVAVFQYPRAMEAKPASFQSKPVSLFLPLSLSLNHNSDHGMCFGLFAGYSKVFNTLGVVCKCCDGEGGECRTTWEGSCPKLQCLPWKYH